MLFDHEEAKVSVYVLKLLNPLHRCFTTPQSGSGTQFIPQQNSPIPSPYTPQSPVDYIQYNPQSYSQHQQTQQGEYQ